MGLSAHNSVDDTDRVQLILFGTPSSIGGPGSPPPLADVLHDAGLAAINTDPVLVLTSGRAGSSINITGSPTKSLAAAKRTTPYLARAQCSSDSSRGRCLRALREATCVSE